MSIEKLVVHETDILKTILEYLSSRNYHVTMRTLEKESCILNCNSSDEMLYIRELILDGDYNELLQLVNTLTSRFQFNVKRFHYLVLRQQFIELIYMRSHIIDKEQKTGIADVIKTLSQLEIYCPSKDDYNNLCWLLTVPNLHAHDSFRDWTLDMSRLKCFEDLTKCFDVKTPCLQSQQNNTSDPDRLLQLLVKGLFYELCTEYCQSVATGESVNLEKRVDVLHSTPDASTSSLLCWIQSLPVDVFQAPFEQFEIDIHYLNSKEKSQKFQKLSFDHQIQMKPSDTNNLDIHNEQTLSKSSDNDLPIRSSFESKTDNTDQLKSSNNVINFPDKKIQTPNISKQPSIIPKELDQNRSDNQKAISKSHEPFIPEAMETDGLYHSTPIDACEKNALRYSAPVTTTEVNVFGNSTTNTNVQDVNGDDVMKDNQEVLNNKEIPVVDQNIEYQPLEIREQIAKEPSKAVNKKHSEILASLHTSNSLPVSKKQPSLEEQVHKSSDLKSSQDVQMQENQEKENLPSQENVVLGPVINGVRRPISEKYLGVNQAYQARKAQENAALENSNTKAEESPPQTRTSKESNRDREDHTSQERNNTENFQKRSSDVEQRYSPVEMLQDSQAIRSVAFNPNGCLYAVGANTKTLRVCRIANDYHQLQKGDKLPMQVVFKRTKYHRGSIYCMAWNDDGRLLASGSNDKSIKILEFDPDNYTQINDDYELNIHQGTIRELAFVPNKPGILVSGGAGDGIINITDVIPRKVIGSLNGHSGNVLTVYAGDNNLVVTGGSDNTLRLWDLRSERCIDVVMVGESSPASVTLNSKYIASGQEDGSILVYDMAAGRTIQNFRLHQQDCRSVRFSPDSKYLLTSSYDKTVSLLHLHKHLYDGVPTHYVVAQLEDKVIQSRWHPNENMFLTSSADKTAVLWKAH